MRGLHVLELPSVLLVSALLLMDTDRAVPEEPQKMELRPFHFSARSSPRAESTPWTFEPEVKSRVMVDGVSLDHRSGDDAHRAYLRHTKTFSGHHEEIGRLEFEDDRLTQFSGCCLELSSGLVFQEGDSVDNVVKALGTPLRIQHGELYCGAGDHVTHLFRVPKGYMIMLSWNHNESLPEELRGRVERFALTGERPSWAK